MLKRMNKAQNFRNKRKYKKGNSRDSREIDCVKFIRMSVDEKMSYALENKLILADS